MKTDIITLDNLAHDLSLIDGADSSLWPTVEIVLTFNVHPAEPDVGIFGPQIEIIDIIYRINDVSYRSEKSFIEDIYASICGDIEDDEAVLQSKISAYIDDWVREYEGDDY